MEDGVDELVARHAAAGTPCVVATVVRTRPPTSARAGDRAVITADGRLRGWIGGSCSEPVVRREALRALAEGTPRLVHIVAGEDVRETSTVGELTLATTCPSGGSLDVFVEPRLPRPQLIVFGESPAARTLVRLGSATRFRTCAVLQGGREGEVAGADLILGGLDLAPASPGQDSWAVVATMGHYDEEALEAALAFPGLDVSLVASSRRAAAVLEALRRKGLDEGSLSRVRAPAGAVRGTTQEEIALLALADLVSVRRRRLGAVRPALVPEFATDPVCGMAVEVATSRHTAERSGQTYFFCCEGCLSAFEKSA